MRDPNFDLTEAVGDYPFNNEVYMSNIFNLNWKDLGSAVVSAVIVALLQYIASLTHVISQFDWHFALGLAITVFATSLLKALGTTSAGKFAGVFPIK